MTAIYLAHQAHGNGSGCGYRANLERIRAIEAGCRRVNPLVDWRRAAGRTPEDDPSTGAIPSAECVALTQRRMILGTGAATGLGGPAAGVWLCPSPEGSADALIEDACLLAGLVGAEVWALSFLEVGYFLQLGSQAAQERTARLACACLGAPLDTYSAEPDRPVFTHPEQVVRAYFCEAESVLGSRALPMSMRVQNGSNRHAQVGRAIETGLRVAVAEGIFGRARHDPRWQKYSEQLLWWVFVRGGSYEGVAEQVAVSVGTAWNHTQGALSALADAMRERRAEQREMAPRAIPRDSP